MGATNCPETPRQKMISMMYLVLTALLALNVSAEIVNAFVLIDQSLVKTNESFELKNKSVYSAFAKAEIENASKVKQFKEKADELKVKTDEIFKYIDELKLEIIQTADGKDVKSIEAENIKKKDENNIGSQILIGQDGKGKGLTLAKKISELREHILNMKRADGKSMINDASMRENIESVLSTANMKGHGENVSVEWHRGIFEHMPLVACICNLSKIQNNLRNVESDVINFLYKKITADDIPINKIEAVVKSRSNAVFQGEEYYAEVFLAAYDSVSQPTVKLTGGQNLPVEKGKGIRKLSASGIGTTSWGGVIELKTPGGLKKYPFKEEYQVMPPAAIVSPSKMNVFYIGVDNPVDVSVPGVSSDKVFASMPSNFGGLIKSGNSYIVRPTTQTTKTNLCNITVTAEINKQKKVMGSIPFRIKTLPTPRAKIAGSYGGDIDRQTLSVALGVIAEMENFDFDAKFNILSYTVEGIEKGMLRSFYIKGPSLSPEVKNFIKGLNKFSKVFISDILAKGPDGTTRKLQPVTFKLK